MKDSEIVELYWSRSEQAILETKTKYDRYCTAVAYNILSSVEDSEECVSDTYLRVWNSIPPSKPENLKAYIGKITRNLALDRVRANNTQKRGVLPLVLDELTTVGLDTVEEEINRKLLSDAITGFLRTLPPMKRRIFILRYWYFESISGIAEKTGWSDNRIKVDLFRTRKKLAEYLKKEGFSL